MTSCRKYQRKINNASLQKSACAVCWELVFKIRGLRSSRCSRCGGWALQRSSRTIELETRETRFDLWRDV
jgi:DNA-directed RNA polymerase subunit RPC12/RpoP